MIKHKTKDKWVHYNPHIEAYYDGDTKHGACTFPEHSARAFIIEDLKDEANWQMVEFDFPVIKRPGVSETQLYDESHG